MSRHGREDEPRYTQNEAEGLANKAWAARKAIRMFLTRWDQSAEDTNLRAAAAELRAWAVLHQVIEAPEAVAQRRAKRRAEIDAEIERLRAERAKL